MPPQGLGLTLAVHEGAEGVCLPRGEPGQWTMRLGVRAAAGHDRAGSSASGYYGITVYPAYCNTPGILYC